jgi:hypothetical protein
MATDIGNLAAAIASVSGSAQIALVAAVKQATTLALLSPGTPPLTFASASLAAGTAIAIALPALVTAVGTPEIMAGPHVAIHESTTPLPLVDIGGVMVTPIRSQYQTDSISLKLRMPATWTLRSANAVSYVTGVTW